jgi:hypothetical protein
MKLGNAHKALFYEKYNAMLSSKIGKTKELDEEKYNYIVQVKLNYRRMMGINVVSTDVPMRLSINEAK